MLIKSAGTERLLGTIYKIFEHEADQKLKYPELELTEHAAPDIYKVCVSTNH